MRMRAAAVTVLFVALVIGGLCLPLSRSIPTLSTPSKSSVRLVVHLPKRPESSTAYSQPSTTASIMRLQLTRQVTMDHLEVVNFDNFLVQWHAARVAAAASAATQPTTTSAAPSGDLYAEWTKVAICESGGWGHGTGGKYIGDLGITVANWYDNGGGSDTSPGAQIAVDERLIARYGMNIPDQNGCGGGY